MNKITHSLLLLAASFIIISAAFAANPLTYSLGNVSNLTDQPVSITFYETDGTGAGAYPCFVQTLSGQSSAAVKNIGCKHNIVKMAWNFNNSANTPQIVDLNPYCQVPDNKGCVYNSKLAEVIDGKKEYCLTDLNFLSTHICVSPKSSTL